MPPPNEIVKAEPTRLPVPHEAALLAALPKDLAMVKIEGDQIMSAAIAHPRNHQTIMDDIKSQIAAYPKFAKSCIFVKPAGKDKKTGKMNYVRGLSIRAAEGLASVWGFNKKRMSITPLDADKAKVIAVFTDYQTGTTIEVERVVCKDYEAVNWVNNRPSGTRKARHADDRFYDIVCPAIASKCLREAILRSIPAGLKEELYEAAEDAVMAKIDDATAKKMVLQFGTKSVEQEQLEGFIGKKLAEFTQEDRLILLGLWNEIEQGECTVAEIFGGEPEERDPGQSKSEALAKKLETVPTP